SFKFLFSELPIGTKFSYITCFLYWWTFIRRFIYIISPILFTVFGLVVVDCSLKELLFIWLPSYVIYNRSLKVLSGKIRDQKWSNIVDTTIFPYMMIPILAETIGIKLKKFAVTPKAVTSERNVSIRYAIPHILLAVADVVALVMCVYEMIVYKNVGNIIILYWLIVNLYFLVMAIIFMIGRINYRSDERFYAAVLVELETPYEVLEGYTLDLSEGGLAVELDNPQFIPPDEDLNVTVTYDDYKAIFKARIKHVQQLKKGWKYSIKVVEMSKYDKQEYMQIIYDREHTLATKINSYFIKDIYGAIKGKAHHGFLSNRKLPRIPLEFSVQSVEGQSIKIVNYNYEYLLLQGIYREEEIHLRVGGDNQITCMPEHRDEKLNYTLCKIKAWKEVARNQSIQTCLLYKPQKVVVSQDIGGMSV
ncbi:MAG: PilZ domain-containing protein, partial [Clostridium sp.]